jgi:hypothetical protein
MNDTKLVGDLTQAHIDQLATSAAKAFLAKAGLEIKLNQAKVTLGRMRAGMTRHGIWQSNRQKGGKGRNINGAKSPVQADKIKSRLRALGQRIDDLNWQGVWLVDS